MVKILRKRTFRKKGSGMAAKSRKIYKRKPRVYRKRGVDRTDHTVQKLNPGRDKCLYVRKTSTIIPSYGAPNGTSGGFQFSLGTSGFSYSAILSFDPAGVFGNINGTISSAASLLTTSQLPEWVNYKGLYGYYKVKKIHLRFTALDINSSLGTTSPVLMLRYNNEYATTLSSLNPTPTSISEEKNWIRKTFTPEHPDFTYSFYPKVMNLTDNAGVLGTDTRVPKSMPWTNVSTPVELYGIKMYLNWPGAPTGTNCLINCDITYDMCFKEQS